MQVLQQVPLLSNTFLIDAVSLVGLLESHQNRSSFAISSFNSHMIPKKVINAMSGSELSNILFYPFALKRSRVNWKVTDIFDSSLPLI